MARQYKTGKAQREAVKRYQERNKGKQKGIGATFGAAECDFIQKIFKEHGAKPSEVLRGAAAALLDGQPIRTEAEPLPIPAADVETTDQSDGNDPTDPRED